MVFTKFSLTLQYHPSLIYRCHVPHSGSTIPPFKRCALRCQLAFLAGWAFDTSHASAERFSSLGRLATRLQFAGFLGDRRLEISTCFALSGGPALSVQTALFIVLVGVVPMEWFALLFLSGF